MRELLADPEVVVAVGADRDVLDDLESVLAAGDAGAVTAVDGTEDAVATVEDRDDVGCAVLLAVDDVAGACRRLREADRTLPVLVHVADLADDAAAAVAAVPECRYLPRTAAPAAVRSAVDDALATRERRRGEAADSEILTTLLAESDVSIFAKDDAGRYVRSTALMDDADETDVVGKTDREVFGTRNPRTAESTYRDDLAVVESGEPIRSQRERFRTGHWSETTKIPLRDDDGTVRGLVGYAVDVTEAVEAKNELDVQRRRFDQFASYVAHDLRSPLQVASGALELARETDDPDAYDRIADAHDRMGQIIDDLRQLAEEDGELGSGTAFGVLDPIETTLLPDLVADIWELTAPESARLQLDVPEGTTVAVESERLRPLIENLIKNAVDHAGPGVTVRVGTVGDRGFFVEDDGPGIPSDRRDRVLERGYTTADDGTGTGLAIVTEIVSRQNWQLSVEEGVRGGARFEVTDCPVVEPVDATPGDRVDLSSSTDVGPVAVEGETVREKETDRITLAGGGEDLWADIDEFHFCFAELDGPVRVQARIEDLDGVDEYSKAGLIVRDEAAPSGPFCYVGASTDHGSEVIWRTEPETLADSEQFEEPRGSYSWYRVDRVDDVVTCSVSPDGEDWTAIDQRRVELSDPVSVGILVCSHETGERCEATFADVAVTRLDVAASDVD